MASEENKFNLNNFDKKIMNPLLLQKGKKYYHEGAVLDIGESKGNWTAEVEGAEIYDITVTLESDQEISGYFCNCPYDGNLCKHVIAVFFAMREEVKKQKNIPKKSTKKLGFEALLKKIGAAEYSEFIAQYAAKNKNFKIEFELFFADKDERIDISAKYAELIKKLVKKHSTRGFVEYRASSSLAKEVHQFIDKGKALYSEKNYKDAFAVAKTVLKEMMQVITACDDSNGSLSGTVFYSVELISSIAKCGDAAMDMKEQLFNFLQTELNERLYFDYGDFGYNMFSVFKYLAILLQKDREYLNFIDTLLPLLTGKYDDYRIEFFKKQKIDFLQAIGREDEVEKLIQQNLDIKEVRRGEVNKAIDKKDFTAAKKLIADGIKIAEEKEHPGTVSEWEKELLRIAVLENDLPFVRKYCKRFAFDRFNNKEYYNQWKATFDKEEWPCVIEEVITETIQKITKGHDKNSWYSINSKLLDALAPIYIEEMYWDRLFTLVKNEPGLEKLMQYHSYLAQQYPAELLQLYLPALAHQGDKASDRRDYANLAAAMREIIKDIPSGKDKVIAVAKSLKDKYSRKPAMIDELNTLLKL